MIKRNAWTLLEKRIQQYPVVALVGSRQVGKTTLALSIHSDKEVLYLDLERPSDVAKLGDPELYLTKHKGKLIILDEIQRLPEVFPVLRSLVDERRRDGEKSAQFLILGSASPELLQQSSETLAGRISYHELSPLNLTEIKKNTDSQDQHWFRGGYPESYLSENDEMAMQWCEDFVLSYVERYLPQQGVTLAPVQLRRLCTMMAHQQGSTLNLSTLSKSLGIDGKTVRHYIDLLMGLFVVRSLPAWNKNAGKRLVKSPKIYIRDTGILHVLAGLHSLDQVLGHPICGHSWEGYCIEQILNQQKSHHVVASHYRTQAGAEIDLVIENRQGETMAIEIKRTLSPKLTPAFKESMKTIEASRGYYVIPEGESFFLSENVQAISLAEFLTLEW